MTDKPHDHQQQFPGQFQQRSITTPSGQAPGYKVRKVESLPPQGQMMDYVWDESQQKVCVWNGIEWVCWGSEHAGCYDFVVAEDGSGTHTSLYGTDGEDGAWGAAKASMDGTNGSEVRTILMCNSETMPDALNVNGLNGIIHITSHGGGEGSDHNSGEESPKRVFLDSLGFGAIFYQGAGDLTGHINACHPGMVLSDIKLFPGQVFWCDGGDATHRPALVNLINCHLDMGLILECSGAGSLNLTDLVVRDCTGLIEKFWHDPDNNTAPRRFESYDNAITMNHWWDSTGACSNGILVSGGSYYTNAKTTIPNNALAYTFREFDYEHETHATLYGGSNQVALRTLSTSTGIRDLTLQSIKFKATSVDSVLANFASAVGGDIGLFVDDIYGYRDFAPAQTMITIDANWGQVTVGVVGGRNWSSLVGGGGGYVPATGTPSRIQDSDNTTWVDTDDVAELISFGADGVERAFIDEFGLAPQLYAFYEVSTATIAADAITATGSFMVVDTQAAAATDDLKTITPPNVNLPYLLFLKPANDARTIVIKHGTGNIKCVGNADITLDDAHDVVILLYDSVTDIWTAQLAGTGGGAHNHTTADGSGVLTDDEHDGFGEYAEIATPATPAANKLRVFAKDVGGVAKLHVIYDSGFTQELGLPSWPAVTDDTLLTIAAGEITVTQDHHRINTEASAASDDLETITGLVSNKLYLLRPDSGARTVVLIHGASNILCPNNTDVTLDDVHDWVLVFSPDGNFAYVLASGGAGGGGSVATDAIWDAVGDVVVGLGANSAARLAITVPAADILNALGVVNGETTPTWKSLMDATAPTTQAFGDAAAAGAGVKLARVTHKHAMPADPVTAHVAAGDPHTAYALDTDLSTHAGAADPHTGYVREADANWIDLTDGGASTLHSHAGGSALIVQLNDATVEATAATLDFDGDFAVTASPATEANISLDLAAGWFWEKT